MLTIVMLILPELWSGAAFVASKARSSVLQNVVWPPLSARPFATPEDDEELVPEPGFGLPVFAPPEPDPLSGDDPPPDDEDGEDEDEGFLAAGACAESSPLLQAVSDRAAARPKTASPAVRDSFMMIPSR
ncbi:MULTISPECIES: hypothetical protein [unclassified Streptomyces]|uniref:hypothetical protein n=1 Tax=unclassified Streptomyces TaxID=2593676 RepID=UPI002E0F0DA6|nr:hypothetical protein OG299_06940 [Streptomyces sp. NBC_01296]WSW64278.1 hypothetical protein OG513_34680 [Streptomyces sp. NBC_00998]